MAELDIAPQFGAELKACLPISCVVCLVDMQI